MESFGKFYRAGEQKGVEHRHLKDVIPDANSHSKSPGKTVPEYCRTKQVNNKYDSLLKKAHGSYVLSKRDILEIQKQHPQFDFEFTDNQKPKKLGNTGIIVSFDPSTRRAYISK